MAALTASATPLVITTGSSSSPNSPRPHPIKSLLQQRRSFCTKTTRRRLASSSSPNSKPEEEDKSSTNPFSSPDNLSYLWKLGAGSVGGAVVIKYGSILFPVITRPNIIEALFMVSAPMLVAVVLMIKESIGDDE